MKRLVVSIFVVACFATYILPAYAQAFSRLHKELPILADGVLPPPPADSVNFNYPASQDTSPYGLGWHYNDVHRINGAVFAISDSESIPSRYSGFPTMLAGGFDSIDGQPSGFIAQRCNSDTKFCSLGGGLNGPVYTIAKAIEGTDTMYYVGGNFTMAGGAPAKHIAMWDGAQWHALGAGTDSTVLALTVISHTLYVGGNFTHAGGQQANYIATWNIDGQTWSPIMDGQINGVNGGVAVLFYNVRGDSALYVGGGFTTSGHISASKIAKYLNGQWSALGTGIGGTNAFVEDIISNGYPSNIGVCGSFSIAGDSSAQNIASWDNGWQSLFFGRNAGANGPVYAMYTGMVGIVFTGDFSIFNGASVHNIAIISQTSDIYTDFRNGLNGIGYVLSGTLFDLVTSITSLPDEINYIYVGGTFTATNDTLSPGLGYWVTNSPGAVIEPQPLPIPQLQNFPNPFTDATTIAYSFPAEEPVTLNVYNSLGEKVGTMDAGIKPTGQHTITFTGDGLQNGTYFYRLSAGKYFQTGKMNIVR